MGGKITDVMIQKTMAVTTAERNKKVGLQRLQEQQRPPEGAV